MPIITKRKSAKSQYPFSSSLYLIYGCSFKYVCKRFSLIGLKQPLKGTIFPLSSKACNTWKAAIWFILKVFKINHDCFQSIRISYNISCMNTTPQLLGKRREILSDSSFPFFWALNFTIFPNVFFDPGCGSHKELCTAVFSIALLWLYS